MANERNLKRLTPKQAREQGRRGGKASAKKRAERKAMQEIARIVLDMPMERGGLADIEGLAFEDYPDANLTLGQAAVLAVAKKAKRGDVQALQFLRDTAGEKPVDKVEVSGDVAAAAKGIREMIAAAKERPDGR